MENLTPRQKTVIEFITGYLDQDDNPPTMQEIAGHLGISGNLES